MIGPLAETFCDLITLSLASEQQIGEHILSGRKNLVGQGTTLKGRAITDCICECTAWVALARAAERRSLIWSTTLRVFELVRRLMNGGNLGYRQVQAFYGYAVGVVVYGREIREDS